MNQPNIDTLRGEALRQIEQLIQLLQDTRAGGLLQAPASSKDERRSLDTESQPQAIEMLENERSKLENLDMVLAVVGTMKAGKSTTINAIVGAEVLPNRNRPMTALPTLIRHTPGQTQPRLTLEKVQPLTDLLARLRPALAQAAPGTLKSLESNDDMAELLAQIRDQRPFGTRCEGVEQIFHLLKSLNDLVRLCSELEMEFPFAEYATVDALPVIEVEFSHLKNATDAPGRFTLLDTPGPNEFKQPHLKKMLRDQLRKASAVLAVFDYTQLKSEADADVRSELKEIAKNFDGRMYALVNKFDQKTKNSDDGETVKKIVSSELMDGLIAESHVFPVSSFQGYLANHARHELALHKKIKPNEPWVEDFGKETFGKFWRNQINDPALVKKAADMLWEDSGFPAPLAEVIVVAHQNAARLALQSTSRKLLDQADNAHQFLQFIISTSEKSIEELEESIQAVQASIDSARNIADEVKKSLDEELARMAKTIDEAKGRTLENAAKELHKYFKEGKRDEEKRKEAASKRGKKSKKKRGKKNGRNRRLG
ncbi:MAG: dynamin family protein [Ottowia sp.]